MQDTTLIAGRSQQSNERLTTGNVLTSKPTVRVAPTTYDDLHGIAVCDMLAFSGAFPPFEPFSRLLHPFRIPLIRSGAHPRHWPEYSYTVRSRAQNLRDGSILFTAFLPDDAGREIVVGMVKMTAPRDIVERRRRNRKWKERVLDDVVYPALDGVRSKFAKDVDGMDHAVLRLFKKEQHAARERVDRDGQYYLINLIFVHPSYQNCGVGSALLAECIAITEASRTPLVLESTTAGLPLYSARGFVQVDKIAFEFANERIEMPIMIRQPQIPNMEDDSDLVVPSKGDQGDDTGSEDEFVDAE